MSNFYIVENGLLISSGYAPDGQEDQQALPNQTVVIGTPPGFIPRNPPFVGARWHIDKQAWVDTRNTTQIQEAKLSNILEARYKEYPPQRDYLDAVYWQAKGDNSKMDTYLAAVEAVKIKYPKPEGIADEL